MRPVRIIPYGASDSVSALVDNLRSNRVDIKRIKLSGSNYRGNNDHLIINWGSHTTHNIRPEFNVLNKPEAVIIASDKIKTFQKLSETIPGNIPKFTTLESDAIDWARSGMTIYCRTLTRASQGRGIIVANSAEEVVGAPLYTVKCPRRREVRIHVFNGQVISFAQKKKMSEERLAEDGITYSNDVRSHSNGWVFAREGVVIPDDAQAVAIAAVSALGLDFGAVDMALSLNPPKVFEVNTAPGLEGQTLEAYANAILNLIR